MNKKKIIIISSIIALLVAASVITVLLLNNKTKRYEIPLVIFADESKNWTNEDCEKYAKTLINSFGSDYCKKAYYEDKNIVIYFTEKQRKKAVKNMAQMINDDTFSALDSMVGYKIIFVSSDYKTINVMFNEEYNEEAFYKIIEYPTLLTIQIYNGEKADDASVTVNADFLGSDEEKTKIIKVDDLYK